MKYLCTTCKDTGFVIVEVHVCGGDPEKCYRLCPAEGQEQCPDCAWPIYDDESSRYLIREEDF